MVLAVNRLINGISRSRSMGRLRVLSVGMAIGVISSPAVAELPQGGSFDAQFGSGTIVNSPAGNYQGVYLNGNNALINWDSFNIGAGDHVHFQSWASPNDFRVLNKINQGTPSMIRGTITGNGMVGMVNPAGVIFFGSSVVNVGSFLAASANTIDEASFLTNINNDFSLQCGQFGINILPGAKLQAAENMMLVGRTVTNRGTLIAPTVVMAGGLDNDDQVTIKKLGDVISLRINGEDLGLDADSNPGNEDNFYTPDAGQQDPTNRFSTSVRNDGQIIASKHVALAAGDLYGFAIHNTGTISADGGQIDAVAMTGLVHNTGRLDSIGENGGTVRIAAPAIVNGSGGVISVDGDSLPGGGSGGHVLLSSCQNTILESGSVISANAFQANNDGGTITSISQNSQYLEQGSLLIARGAAVGGDGGTINIQSDNLVSEGFLRVNAGGAYGQINLATVQDLNIVDDALDQAWDLENLANPVADDSQISVGSSLLFVDANLSLETDGVLTFDTDLDVNPANGQRRVKGNLRLSGDRIDLANAGLTSISADGDLFATGDIEMASGVGTGLNIESGRSMVIHGNIGKSSPLDSITMAAGDFIVLGDSESFMDSGMIRANGDILFNPDGNSWLEDTGISTISVFADNFEITSNTGDVTFGEMQALSTAGNLSLNAGNRITLGDVNVSGDLDVTASEIQIRLREEIEVRNAEGMTPSSATSIVANGDISFSSTPTFDASSGFEAPIFAAGVGQQTEGVLAEQVWGAIEDFNHMTLALEEDGQMLLGLMTPGVDIPVDPVDPVGPVPPVDPVNPDPAAPPADPAAAVVPAEAGTATGGGAQSTGAAAGAETLAEANNITDSIAADSQITVNAEAEVAEITPDATPGTNVSLADFGVEIKPTEGGQRDAFVNDYAADIAGPGDGLIRVSQQRLDMDAAARAANQYENVLTSQPGLSPDGLASRDTSAMASSLNQAYSDFSNSAASNSGEDFASWLNSSDVDPQAKTYLDGMQASFRDLGNAGLNSTEVGQSSLFVARNILGSNDLALTPQVLAQAMAPKQ